MIFFRRYFNQISIFCSLLFFVFFSCSIKVSSNEINWVEIARTDNEIQFIDSKSIKYNKKGLLSVITKHTEVNTDGQENQKAYSYLMVVDCKNRLFSNLPINGNLMRVNNWENPTNNKLIKKTIINSCSY